jgi:hypothetical protein
MRFAASTLSEIRIPSTASFPIGFALQRMLVVAQEASSAPARNAAATRSVRFGGFRGQTILRVGGFSTGPAMG